MLVTRAPAAAPRDNAGWTLLGEGVGAPEEGEDDAVELVAAVWSHRGGGLARAGALTALLGADEAAAAVGVVPAAGVVRWRPTAWRALVVDVPAGEEPSPRVAAFLAAACDVVVVAAAGAGEAAAMVAALAAAAEGGPVEAAVVVAPADEDDVPGAVAAARAAARPSRVRVGGCAAAFPDPRDGYSSPEDAAWAAERLGTALRTAPRPASRLPRPLTERGWAALACRAWNGGSA